MRTAVYLPMVSCCEEIYFLEDKLNLDPFSFALDFINFSLNFQPAFNKINSSIFVLCSGPWKTKEEKFIQTIFENDVQS